MEFLKGVDLQSLYPDQRISIIYPSNSEIKSIEKLFQCSLCQLQKEDMYKILLNHMVTRCPNVYANRSQNAFLSIDRHRYIADFESNTITDIERNYTCKIMTNKMINGIRYIEVCLKIGY